MCNNWERCSESLQELRTLLERINSVLASSVQKEERYLVGSRKAVKHVEELMQKAKRENSWCKSLLKTCCWLMGNAYRKRSQAERQMVGDGKQEESDDSADA